MRLSLAICAAAARIGYFYFRLGLAVLKLSRLQNEFEISQFSQNIPYSAEEKFVIVQQRMPECVIGIHEESTAFLLLCLIAFLYFSLVLSSLCWVYISSNYIILCRLREGHFCEKTKW